MRLPGSATPEGTARYRKRFDGKIPLEHFRHAQSLWMSSIGIGTYLGNYDDATDQAYHQAVVRAVEAGCNVIDSAINYRLQRSERSIGTALKEMATKGYSRDEIVIATKGGFIPYDGTPPKDARNQLDSSLCNLDVECIDIYYLHNPETQLGTIAREEFGNRLSKAFETMEEAVTSGKIRMYGIATWNAFRNEVSAKDYLSLAQVVALAEKAGGKNHHFKVIQLPLNLGMSEALSNANQRVGDKELTVLEAAQALDVTVMCSASVLQGQLTRNLPSIIGETFEGMETDGQRALQFVRSTPGVTTALVGMKQLSHVEENLNTARIAPASWEQYSKLFQSA